MSKLAQISAHTVPFAKAVGATGKVLTFEPQRTVFHMLCGNLALNGLSNVQAINGGLGAEAATLRVPSIDYASEHNFGGAQLSESGDGHAVSVTTLDSWELEACHLIKADVEGMELEVLQGATETIKRFNPFLYIENDRTDLSKGLLEWLLRANYRLYWHICQLFSENNFFANQENVFSGYLCVNVLGVPSTSTINVTQMRQITSPEDRWN